jgi:hypothetical protein
VCSEKGASPRFVAQDKAAAKQQESTVKQQFKKQYNSSKAAVNSSETTFKEAVKQQESSRKATGKQQ